MELNLSHKNQLKLKGSLFYLEYGAIAQQAAAIMSHFKEINETRNRQLQITHVELKLYFDACSESTDNLITVTLYYPLDCHLRIACY